MGSCFSSSSASAAFAAASMPPTAKVINADGSLKEYSLPIKVAHVLGLNYPTFFLCNADEFFYGHHIQALDVNHLLELGKLYFLLPEKMLNHPLTASEMVALAVSANSAFGDTALMRTKKRNSETRIMPIVTEMEFEGYERANEVGVGSWKTERGGRDSDEVKQEFLKRWASSIKRSFRHSLFSIEEVYDESATLIS